MDPLVETLRQVLAPWRGSAAWVLAFSGGCDSRVLLDLISRLRDSDPGVPPVRAIHIDHSLHPDSANWAALCQSWASTANIPISTHRVSLEGSRQGLESLARTARYAVFEQELAAGETLLMAHHQDDQVETLMLRMMRGAGVDGLAAMPAQRGLGAGQLFRPLLAVPRQVLREYAESRALEWIEDPSNESLHFDRNFLRHRLLPVLAERWPDYRARLDKVSALQAEASTVLESYLADELATILADNGSLDMNALAVFSPPRQRALLRHFLRERLALSPERRHIDELLRQCLAPDDGQPQLCLQGKILRRYQGRLYCLPASLPHSLTEPLLWADVGAPQALPGGVLSAQAGGNFLPRGRVTIAQRQQGMRCQLAGEAHSRSLKKLLQEWGIPPWERDTLPLVYCDGELAAVADLAVCEGYRCEVGQGWSLHWDAAR